MKRQQVVLITAISSVVTLLMVIAMLSTFSGAVAALEPTAQSPQAGINYLSIPATAFRPTDSDTTYGFNRQMLTAQSNTDKFNRLQTFVAPIILADGTIIAEMTIFGQDFSEENDVRVRLLQCEHRQNRCDMLADVNSSGISTAGQFEFPTAKIANSVIDNYRYSYLLEVDLMPSPQIGLKAVRLALIPNQPLEPDLAGINNWQLADGIHTFRLPNTSRVQARICTNDLSHLDNPTHYPTLIIDDTEIVPLSSRQCVIVRGFKFELRRGLNVGDSSGTFEFLR